MYFVINCKVVNIILENINLLPNILKRLVSNIEHELELILNKLTPKIYKKIPPKY